MSVCAYLHAGEKVTTSQMPIFCKSLENVTNTPLKAIITTGMSIIRYLHMLKLCMWCYNKGDTPHLMSSVDGVFLIVFPNQKA